MKPTIQKICLIAILVVCYITPLYAATNKYALLVGISNYEKKPLAGPVNDVRAVRASLIEHWNFESNNIDILLDSRATKKNILNGIRSLHKNSKAGDEIFIYLSGHGTSGSDKSLSTPLPTTTGAFIPFDINNIKDSNDLVNRLIIGKRDFRPLLDQLDKGQRKVFVAIDACYSGNTVRGNQAKTHPPSRFMTLSSLLPRRGFGDDLTPMKSKDWIEADADSNNNYPYQNIFYLSASGEHEPAEDIPPELISKYPTIDLKPHGAFTDSFLRALNNHQGTDIDKDGLITYAELKKTIRNTMRLNGFHHTPNGLPSLAEDKHNLATRGIFGTSRGLTRVSQSKTNETSNPVAPIIKPAIIQKAIATTTTPKLKIRLEKSLNFLRKNLVIIKDFSIVNDAEDILLKKQNKKIILVSSAGDLIYALKEDDLSDLIAVLKRHSWSKKILHKKINQNFLVELELFKAGSGSSAVNGELINFSIKSSKDAHFLLIDFDPSGLVSVLFPYNENELKKYGANTRLSLKNNSRVRPPFGKDSLHLFAFSESTPEYESLVGAIFDNTSSHATTLKHLINNKQLYKASATLELITVENL